MERLEKLSKALPFLTTTSGINILEAIERQVPEAKDQITVNVHMGDRSPVLVSPQFGEKSVLQFGHAEVQVNVATGAEAPDVTNNLSEAEFNAMKEELDRLSAISRSKEWQVRLSWFLAWVVLLGASAIFLWGLFQLIATGGTDAALRALTGVVGSYFSTVLLKLYKNADEAFDRNEERRKPLWEALIGKRPS